MDVGTMAATIARVKGLPDTAAGRAEAAQQAAERAAETAQQYGQQIVISGQTLIIGGGS